MNGQRKLSKKTLGLIDASKEERIAHINKTIFIPYRKANELLSEMEDILEHPKIYRMPNMLIVARPDNGKTHLLREFMLRHPAEDRKELDSVFAPVIYVQSPPGPSEHIFLNKMLMMLGVSVTQNDSSDRKLMQLLEILDRVQTKIILLDELNALLAGSVVKQRFFLNMLKYITNELQISIVAAGTQDALQAVKSDAQIESRFPSRILPKWQEGDDFRRLLASFEHVFPLKNESNLSKGSVARKLYGMSNGVLGELSKILKSAAIHAIDIGVEQITLDVLASCPYEARRGNSATDAI